MNKEKVNIETSTYKGIPAMSSPKVHSLLKEIGTKWQGLGVAMELGCWLGGSALPLLEGLKIAGYDKTFWAFDRWRANEEQVSKAKQHRVKLIRGQNLKHTFLWNVEPVGIKVMPIQGDMPGVVQDCFERKPIEICIFDAPKSEPVFSSCIRTLAQLFIPGVTVLGLMDYKFYQRHENAKREKFMAPVLFMEKYEEHFEKIKEWDDECPVFFRYKGGLKM